MAELRIVDEETIRLISRLTRETKLSSEELVKASLRLFEDQL